VAPVDGDVMDRIMAAPRAAEVVANPPESPDLAELKARYGTEDEDELIYRAFLPQTDIDRMRAAGPVRRDYPLLASPELEQVRRLMQLTKLPLVEIKTAGLSVSLRR
jgi:oxaloacetate decarboxylase alpha subunit